MKKLFNVTIDEALLEEFNKRVKAGGYNKSALVELWMKSWMNPFKSYPVGELASFMSRIGCSEDEIMNVSVCVLDKQTDDDKKRYRAEYIETRLKDDDLNGSMS